MNDRLLIKVVNRIVELYFNNYSVQAAIEKAKNEVYEVKDNERGRNI
jgi:hypothetical protein